MCGTTASILYIIVNMRDAGHYEDAEDTVRELKELARGELRDDSADIDHMLSAIEPSIRKAKAADKNHVPPKIRLSQICAHSSLKGN